MRTAGTVVLSQTRDGTHVDLAADLAPRGVCRFMAPLMRPVIRKQNEVAAVRLARALSQDRLVRIHWPEVDELAGLSGSRGLAGNEH
jgi:hypothetical protein